MSVVIGQLTWQVTMKAMEQKSHKLMSFDSSVRQVWVSNYQNISGLYQAVKKQYNYSELVAPQRFLVFFIDLFLELSFKSII